MSSRRGAKPKGRKMGGAGAGSVDARSMTSRSTASFRTESEADSVESSKQMIRAVRSETRRIMTSQIAKREEVKAKYIEERATKAATLARAKKLGERKWKKKMDKSPFLIDLAADHERIDEENRIRLAEAERQRRAMERRKNEVKNDIILKALSEASDLEALRQEKRAIQLEERRLKALLDLERASAHRKADLIAAQRAERHRKEARSAFQREQTRERTFEAQRLQQEILREKHNIRPPKDSASFAD